jgi:hypothetical protein
VCSFAIFSTVNSSFTGANTTNTALQPEQQQAPKPPLQQPESQRVSRVILGADYSQKIPIQFQRRAVIPQITPMIPSKSLAKKARLKNSGFLSNIVDETSIQASMLVKVPLNRYEKLLISKAQRYIDKNWNETTGLIDSVQGYTHATMWDIASSIAAIMALEALEVSNQQVTDLRLAKLLSTLYKLPLYKGKLPNRQYNTITGKPSGRFSQTSSNGNGWSALDLGRLYIWLAIVAKRKPHLAGKVELIKEKWQLTEAVYDKTLYGTKLTSQKEYFRQEGRLGYLQYAATGYRLMNLDVDKAFLCDQLNKVKLDNLALKIDPRNLPFLTLDPFLLYTIEVGNEVSCWNQLDKLYQLHEAKYNSNKRLTAYAEDSLNKSPWFLYNNIYYQGQPWYSVSHSGKPFAESQTFSNKAALAISVIYQSEYSQNLATQVITNSIRHTEIPTGLYHDGKINTAYNINTNSLILVSLWYKTRNQRAILEE